MDRKRARYGPVSKRIRNGPVITGPFGPVTGPYGPVNFYLCIGEVKGIGIYSNFKKAVTRRNVDAILYVQPAM